MPGLPQTPRPYPVVVLVHASDQRPMAQALAKALRRIGGTRKRRITAAPFGDATPELIARADHLLILLSPGLSGDPGVRSALADWRATAPDTPVLLALLSGTLGWDREHGRFSPDAPVPEELRDVYAAEPGYADFSRLSGPRAATLRDDDFRRGVGQIASTLYGLPARDQLDGDDIRDHQKRRRLRVAFLTIVPVLVIVAALTVPQVVHDSREAARDRQATRAAEQAAEANRRSAAARRLVNRARKEDSDSPELRLLFAAQAFVLGDTQAGSVLHSLLRAYGEEKAPLGLLQGRTDEDGVPVALGPDGGVLTGLGTYYAPAAWQPRRTALPDSPRVLALSPGGRHAAVHGTREIGDTVRVAGVEHRCAGQGGAGGCTSAELVDLTTGGSRPLPTEVSALRSGLSDEAGTTQGQPTGADFQPDVFSQDGKYLLSVGTLTDSVYAVPVQDPRRAVTVRLPGRPIAVQPLRDGTVSVLTESTLLAFRPQDGRVVRRVALDAKGVQAAVVRPRAGEVVLARAGRLTFVAIGTGEERGSVDTGLALVQQLAVDPGEGTLAATGGGGGALVDVKGLDVIARGPWGVLGTSARFAGEANGAGTEVAFTADGSRVVMRPLIGESGWGSPVYLWSTDPRSWYRASCALAARTLSDEEWKEYVRLDDDAPHACAPDASG
ncbi:hypothetical protein [Streptomyces liangshanensis]|uniref:TIR domain-containing protein n=1 Tax=Streptomyces liangshanensis TaxID=2717324 RepID=A0A6G9H6V1_9ACTN|nr:hypothetical protein [Streptomyces liangshanensis]QIQ06174.1 hypothetical protein HA039_31120 [Streptomyces liangshanensis]